MPNITGDVTLTLTKNVNHCYCKSSYKGETYY